MSNFTDFIGGGGGGSEINDIKPINTTDLLHTDAEGNKWLREGYLDTDTTTYPAPATVRKNVGEWDGIPNYVNSDIVESLTFDGTSYWYLVYGSSTSYLKKLNATTFVIERTVTISSSTRQNKARGICYDSTNNWLLVYGNANYGRIDKYSTSTGTYLGTLFDAKFRSQANSILSSTYGSGITTDGTYIYTSHNSTNMVKGLLAKWSMAGVLLDRIELPPITRDVNDIQFFDGNIWVVGDNPECLFSIDATTYIWNGDSFDLSRYDTTLHTFAFHGTTCVIPTTLAQPYYLKHPYVTGVGLGRMETPKIYGNGATGKMINYTRIK